MRDNFVKLIDFIFGKYIYTVMKNNDKVLYFEVVDNKYVQPISSFNLYDNAGKSLTSVNEHFFMNQLVSRINVACKKGIFISDQEIVDFLNKIKTSCGDPELIKLFKGSYMNEINEFNFEDNKRNIVRYLDKFKFDTFVDYNNVSVFNGSLEKNVSAEPVVTPSQVESINVQNNITENTVVSSVTNNVDVNESEEMDVVDVIDESTIDNNSSNVQQPENVGTIDFMNIPVDNSVGDVVNSSDYFSNSQVAQNSNQLSQDNLQSPIESQSDLTAPLDFNSLYSNSGNVLEPVQQVQEPVATQDNIVQQDVQSVQEVQTPQLEQPQEIIQPVEQSTVQNVADVQRYPAEQSIVQENPALQPATSTVDLTAPLDFNSLYSHNDSTPNVISNVADQDSIQMVPNSDFDSSALNVISNEDNGVSSDGQYVQPLDINSKSNDIPFSNDGFSLAEPLVENAVDSNLNNNNIMYSEQVLSPGYISDVKNRIEANAFNTELGVMSPNVTESDLDKTVVVDKVSMPPLESVADEGSKKSKKKKSFGVVIFIIILLLVLAGFAYFLYNYIF